MNLIGLHSIEIFKAFLAIKTILDSDKNALYELNKPGLIYSIVIMDSFLYSS